METRPETIKHQMRSMNVSEIAVDLHSEPSDVLGEVLESIQLRSVVSGPWTFNSPWGVRVEVGPPRFYIITHGKCWLELEGAKSPACLVRGDLAVLTHGRRHTFYEPLNSPVIPVDQALLCSRNSRQSASNGNNQTSIVFGSLLFENQDFSSLLSQLPPILHVKGENEKSMSCMDDLLRVIIHESDSIQPGSQTIINRLVHILFIQAIRAYVATLPRIQGNLLAGLLDPEIGPALRLIHLNPEKPWTVASLAEKVCMSRSAFAARFTSLVGNPPLFYLFLCRMNKACNLLRDPHKRIKEIAPRVGYASEAAFSNAFKRWAGMAPGHYRGTMRPA